jgi:hypothetical protein
MSDLGKLRDGDDFAARLLRAGVSDAPRGAARRRAATALGLTLATSGAMVLEGSAQAATAKVVTATAKVGLVALARWLGTGMLAGIVVMGGANVIERAGSRATRRSELQVTHPLATSKASSPRESAPSPLGPRVESMPLESGRVELPHATMTSEVAVEVNQRARGAADAPPSALPAEMLVPAHAAAESALSRELVLLEGVRAKVRAGDGRGALADLDAIRPSVHVLAMEADLLRVEALLESGDGGRARALARELERNNPGGPQSFRLKRLLSAQ